MVSLTFYQKQLTNATPTFREVSKYSRVNHLLELPAIATSNLTGFKNFSIYQFMPLESQPLLIKRRKWLKMCTGSLAAMLACRANAAERTGKWNDASIAKYTQKLFDWLKENFDQRAQTLAKDGGTEFKLEYDYMGPTEDKRRLREFAKFAAGDLTGKASEKHVQLCLTEFERIRKSLAAAESAAAASWKSDVDVIAVKEGRIYDSLLKAGRLTVVLDNSPSMKPYLPVLRKEISRDFQDAYFVEVNGCQLESPAQAPWFYCAPARGINPFTADRHIPKIPTLAERPNAAYWRWSLDAAAALDGMVDLMQSDAIYWFCDFDDPTNDHVIAMFAKKVMARKTKLFVHTLNKRAPKLLVTLAEKSGGGVVKKRI